MDVLSAHSYDTLVELEREDYMKGSLRSGGALQEARYGGIDLVWQRGRKEHVL